MLETKRNYVIYGIPRPQGRPRFARIGKFVKTYERKEDTRYKENVSAQLVAQKPDFFEGAIELSVIFHLPRPKTLPKKILHHTKKPDIDNLIKGLLDSCKGILWHDDAQVITLRVAKIYGSPPMVEIEIERPIF